MVEKVERAAIIENVFCTASLRCCSGGIIVIVLGGVYLYLDMSRARLLA